MAIVRTEAFVVQAFRYGETSMILRLLTRDQGVVPVIARGARRPKSRFGGALDPFHRLAVTYHVKAGREIQTLADAERLARHPAVMGSLERMEAAGSWFRFLRAVVPEGAPSPALFALAVIGLARLEATPTSRVRRWEVYHRARTAALLGLAPELEACVGCRRPLPDGGALAFAIDEGGLVCAACGARGAIGRRLDPAEFAMVALYHHPEYDLVSEMEVIDEKELGIQKLIRDFIRYHADLRSSAA